MVQTPSVPNTVDRLVAQGFVERRPNPHDGRGVLARLTVAGRAAVKRATDDLMADEFGLGMYDERSLDMLFEQLRALRVSAGDFSN